MIDPTEEASGRAKFRPELPAPDDRVPATLSALGAPYVEGPSSARAHVGRKERDPTELERLPARGAGKLDLSAHSEERVLWSGRPP